MAELDESQRIALKMALGLPLCLIKGARGSGKTRVVLQMARCFALRNRRASCAASTPKNSPEGAAGPQLQQRSVVLLCVPSGADPASWARRFQKEAEGGGGGVAPVRICWYSDGRWVAGRSVEGSGHGGSGSAEVLCCRAVDAHEAVLWFGAWCEGSSGGRVAVSQVVVDDCFLMWEMECLVPILMLDGVAPGDLSLVWLVA